MLKIQSHGVAWKHAIKDLHDNEIIGTFYEKVLKKRLINKNLGYKK